eukprot:4145283-Amphidinium_carterae.1
MASEANAEEHASRPQEGTHKIASKLGDHHTNKHNISRHWAGSALTCSWWYHKERWKFWHPTTHDERYSPCDIHLERTRLPLI